MDESDEFGFGAEESLERFEFADPGFGVGGPDFDGESSVGEAHPGADVGFVSAFSDDDFVSGLEGVSVAIGEHPAEGGAGGAEDGSADVIATHDGVDHGVGFGDGLGGFLGGGIVGSDLDVATRHVGVDSVGDGERDLGAAGVVHVDESVFEGGELGADFGEGRRCRSDHLDSLPMDTL